ncbi:MAG TPA: response regulator [Pyrinomonadaceae bacterium]|nr:response regulator [Pyrinomonadaceae bacterium]
MPYPRSQVLCVDDDADACEMLTLLMRAYGIDATCVTSAAEAWRAINKQTFDLYVIDGWLPNLDGFEFCRQIRATDTETPILFYSGAAYEADREKGMAAGANAYIAKPDVEGLITSISSLIVKANARDATARETMPKRKSRGLVSSSTLLRREFV